MTPPVDPRPTMGRVEFVALMAMLVATVAYTIDAMLPALPDIGSQLSPTDPNRAQLVVGSFVLGLGIGTFFVGALADAFGRKPIILAGAILYAASALLAIFAPSLETLLIARLVQGLGASAARIVAVAVIRDLYQGREMARLMSFVMLVFTLAPAIAPMMGAGIIALVGWRGIFFSFLIFAAITTIWMATRLPEPLPPERRTPFRPARLRAALSEIFAHPMVRCSMAVQTLCFAMLFASISSIQQIMDVTFGMGEHFHFWFAGIALAAAFSSILNAALVMRLGMRKLIQMALATEVFLTLGALVILWTGASDGHGFAFYFAWQVTVFFQVGLTMGNLNALALEPLGHIAGMAASITTGIATVGSILLAVPVGLAFDGTPLPLMIGVVVFAALALLLVQRMRKLERVGTATI